MINIDPLWWEAGATSLLAAQSGITMFNDKKKQLPPPSPAVAIGITGQQFVTGALIIAAAVFVLAAAMLASAGIVHHGLALSA